MLAKAENEKAENQETHNPCFDHTANPPPLEVFEKSKTDPSFRTRILLHTIKADVKNNYLNSSLVVDHCECIISPLAEEEYPMWNLTVVFQQISDE